MNTPLPDTKELLSRLTVAAYEAGRIMLEASDIAAQTTMKEGHANFLTVYDSRVQELLYDRCKALCPDVLPSVYFVGEEDGQDSFPEEARRGFTFVIDPIDGTTNFVTGYRPSVTSIGLLKDGGPLLGVIYNPYDDLLFTAVRGEGAFMNGLPIRSSGKGRALSLIAMGTAPYNPEQFDRAYGIGLAYQKQFLDIRRSGASAWEFCQVARGVTGLFYEQTLGLWDYAAGALLVEEAGGTVTDMNGRPLTYDGPSSVVAASAGIVEESRREGLPYLPAQTDILDE